MKIALKQKDFREYSPLKPKISTRMKIAGLFLTCFLCTANADNVHSQIARISMEMKNVTVEDVLNEIEKNSQLHFIYNTNLVNVDRKVNVDFNNESVEAILKNIFKSTNIEYSISDKQIILRPKNMKEVEVVISQQQRKTIKGTVSDDMGPIAGANVSVKGTTIGTMTDVEGHFTLEVPENALLQVSFIGYVPQSIKVANQSNFLVKLREDTQNLDEVIVVGYGTSTKRSLISSVSTVKADEMATLPIANMTQGLAGRAPGLIVQGSGGGINKTNTVSIRGGGTPLVVIDGVIRDYNDFVTLSPEDIESLSILKDASATAVYGARATNGILQVSTKRGTLGTPSISYNFNQSWGKPIVWPKKLDSYGLAYYKNEAARNDGQNEPYSAEDLQKYKDGSDLFRFPNTDWQDLVLKKYAPQQKHNINVSGGNDINNYYISLGFLDQNSLYRSNTHWMKRTNFQLAETVTIPTIGLKTTFNVDGYFQKKVHPYTSTSDSYYQIFSHIQNRTPMQSAVNKYGLPLVGGDNPVAETAADAGYKKERENVANGLMDMEWSLPWVQGLKLRAKGSYRFYQKDNKSWQKSSAQYDWDSTEPQYAAKPKLDQYMETGRAWTMQAFVEYARTFGKHSVSALGGYENTYSYAHSMGIHRDSYDFSIDQINPGPTSTMTNWGSEWEQGRSGWIGQVKYNYNSLYFVEGSIRYDGSDNFPKHHRWGTFYSGSAGWSLGDESFMEVVREKNILNMLKLRVSYGQVGLDNWGNNDDPFHIGRFAYLSSYGLNGRGYVIGGNYVPTFSEGSLPSPDLTWFTTKQFDLGFDFSSLSDRLYGTLDYFYYKTTGFLYAPDQLLIGYTDPLGMSMPKVSTDGEHRRAGFDMQLGWRDHIGDFNYNVSFNFTKFDQLWAKDPRESLDNKKNPYKRTTQQTGYAGIYYNNLGFYKDANDVYNSVKRLNSSNLTGGDLKYEDFNGDGVIDGADQYRMGKSSFPRANYGVNVNLSYKGITFSTLLQGATRFDMYLGTALQMSSGQTGSTPYYSFQKDYWTPENTDARFPRLVSTSGINGSNNSTGSNFWLINGAYLRMKDISVSYDFKKLLLKSQPWIKQLNIGLSGTNVFTISESTKYGLDPENGNTERYDYPNDKSIAININVGF